MAFERINGKMLAAGETFSFNTIVGKRTKANGFYQAIEYAYGDQRMGYGGGVCQASTTMYLAAAKANMTILKREPHSDAVGYTDYGKDATVSDNRIDFKFRNDTGSTIFIVATVMKDSRYDKSNKVCVVSIYGESLGTGVKYEDEDLLDRYNAGEYYNIDSIQFNDSLKYTSLVKKRTVYGGGGIMPDVFVPVDTTEYSKYYRDMLAKGVIYQFALDYVDKHRAELKANYKSVKDFDAKFHLTDDDMKNFIAAGEKEKVKYNEEQYGISKNVFHTFLKGLICRDVFSDDSAYSMIVSHSNKDLQEALRLINDDARYNSLLTTGNTEYEKIAAKHKAKAAQKK